MGDRSGAPPELGADSESTAMESLPQLSSAENSGGVESVGLLSAQASERNVA